MDIHARLRESLQAKGDELMPSPELKAKVMSNFGRKNGKIKSRLIKIALAASILIPTTAYSYQTILSDDLYGSFENVKKHTASITMEGYLLLNAKLSQAKGELNESDFQEFKKGLKIFANAKLEYGDKYGNINYDLLPTEKVSELEKIYMDTQPYFDRLDGRQPSKDLLTPQEYKEYIKAQMTYEKIMVQSEINPKTVDGNEEENVPSNLRAEFQKAKALMEYVNNLQ